MDTPTRDLVLAHCEVPTISNIPAALKAMRLRETDDHWHAGSLYLAALTLLRELGPAPAPSPEPLPEPVPAPVPDLEEA